MIEYALKDRLDINSDDLDNAFSRANQKSETAYSELETLSYSVSHDLRAPLRTIQTNCEWLNAQHAANLDSEGRTLVQQIASSSQHMEKLLDGLLALSRAVSIEYKFSIIDMSTLARAVVDELLRNEHSTSSLLISINPLQPAYGDETLVHQVWYNLLSNAIKYTRYQQNRRVEIDSHQSNGYNVYSVSDNGVGFDMQYANHLFSAFQRLHETEKFEGTGVGLAIVRQIIRKHGGQVWAEGSVDNGARFYFSLPHM